MQLPYRAVGDVSYTHPVRVQWLTATRVPHDRTAPAFSLSDLIFFIWGTGEVITFSPDSILACQQPSHILLGFTELVFFIVLDEHLVHTAAIAGEIVVSPKNDLVMQTIPFAQRATMPKHAQVHTHTSPNAKPQNLLNANLPPQKRQFFFGAVNEKGLAHLSHTVPFLR